MRGGAREYRSTYTPSHETISFDPSSCSRDHLIFYLALTCGRDGADITEDRSHCDRTAAFDGAACAATTTLKHDPEKLQTFRIGSCARTDAWSEVAILKRFRFKARLAASRVPDCGD